MNKITIFITIFAVLLIIGGWVSAEIVSSRTTKSNKKYTKQLALLDRENNKLQKALDQETDRYTHLKEEYDKLREAKAQIRTLELDYKRSTKQFNRMTKGIEQLRQKVTSKKYSSNSLAKDIVLMLDEQFPSDEQKKQLEAEGSKDTFKRIKSAIGMGQAS